MFSKVLCDSGVSINIMPLAIFEELGLKTPSLTTVQLLMADKSIKRSVGIRHDVFVKMDKFILPVDFVILNCEVDIDVPIILGRSFLATGQAVVDVESKDLKFRVNDKEVVFNIFKALKSRDDPGILSIMG